MKGGWQQEEGSQALSDGTALENEMSLVAMAANETSLCIHIRERRQRRGGRTETWKKEARVQKELFRHKTMILAPVSMVANVCVSLLCMCQIIVWGNRE